MSIRVNERLELAKTMREDREREQQALREARQAKIEKKEQFMNNYYNILEAREQSSRYHGKLLEAARNNALSTALKAIYITALEASTLSDNGLALAESMVDSYINERGGASNIFFKAKNTYFNARLQQIVEDAAKDDTDDVEKAGKEESDDATDNKDDEKKESDSDSSENNNDSSSEDEKGDNSDSESKDEKESEDDGKKSKEEKDIDDVLDGSSEDEEGEETDDEDDQENDSSDNDEESSEMDDELDDVEVDETPDDTAEEDDENHGKIFDELEKEEDIKKAIELIRQRVADAEESFIKRNAEDKKRINELLGKISDNIKTVEDISDNDSNESSEEAEIAKEAAMINQRKINDIRDKRPLTVFEKMTRILSENIVKDEVVRESYLDESGKVDFGSIVESSKVMYGFLETVNTLQLETVDEKYIQKLLNEM